MDSANGPPAHVTPPTWCGCIAPQKLQQELISCIVSLCYWQLLVRYHDHESLSIRIFLLHFSLHLTICLDTLNTD